MLEKILIAIIARLIEVALNSPRVDNTTFIYRLLSSFSLASLEQFVQHGESIKLLKSEWDVLPFDFKIDWIR